MHATPISTSAMPTAFDRWLCSSRFGDALSLLRGEQAQEQAEARHDETERHDGEAGAHPRQQRALGGEENAGVAHHRGHGDRKSPNDRRFRYPTKPLPTATRQAGCRLARSDGSHRQENMKSRVAASALCSARRAGDASAGAFAQAYPTKPVTIIVPWPPGGPSDIAARPMAKGLSEELKQTFIIDNRGGAGGNIGSAMVAKAAPDGYTLLITSSAPIVINPSLYKQMPFDPPKDLAPITNLLRVPLILAVHPSVPAKNLKELIAYVNSQKGKIQYASSGNGTPQHLTGELFKSTAKLDMIHVPYKGSAPAITDLIGGHVPIMFDSAIAILPQIKAGKVQGRSPSRAPSARRSLPDVPTFAEAGMPGFESYAWYGFFAPAKTPQGHHRQAQRRGAEGHEEARVAEGAGRDGLRERRRVARAVRRLHQGRSRRSGRRW